ncbi:MAG: prephenate dehydratase, partial [Endomicrobiia bacterium]
KTASAAIASSIAGELYGLKIIAKGIEDISENYTRFLVIGKQLTEKSGNDKTSIMFSIKDRVGALHDMLIPFKKRGINLTKIESRPTRKKAWEYVFFLDFLGHIKEKKIKETLSELSDQCVFLKVLGSYPRAE